VVVIEDMHWADEASLDLVKFLGRRVDRTGTLLIVTCRDDELAPNHPVHSVLGDLPSSTVTRLSLVPLTESAVEALARQARRPSAGLFAATGGNPLFVTEVLATASPGIPATVRDAVLARAGRLSPAARRVVELVSIVPARTERWLLDAVLAPETEFLDECTGAGILRVEGAAVVFRHELARQAVEDSLPPARCQHLHGMVLRAMEALGAEGVGVARLAHHASGAADGEAVLRYAPAAAREASRLSAHREAAAHYAAALQYADRLAPRERAELLEGRAHECYLAGPVDAALASRMEALDIWRRLGDREGEGRNLRWLSRIHWWAGRHVQAEQYGSQAIETLEALPPGRELAMAYSNRSQLHALAYESAKAVHWGTRAIELARALGDHETLSHALNNVGMVEFWDDEDRGRATLEESLRIALTHDLAEHAARAYNNLGTLSLLHRDYPRAARYWSEGFRYVAEHDLEGWPRNMRARQASLRLQQGNLEEALQEAEAAPVVGTGRHTVIIAKAVAATVRVRRGEPSAAQSLNGLLQLIQGATELQDIGPVAAVRAEAAWLKGDLAGCAAEARPGFELALTRPDRWTLGELALWMWRGGALLDPPARMARPFALQISGDWRAAAQEWERIGCPYERAWALADGDEGAQRTALSIFESLGARPATDILRRRFRAQGVRDIPKGTRPGSKGHPHGLSDREVEVLTLLPELQPAQIARRLYLSAKTVEHHVESIYTKLGVHTRAEAVAAAYRLGLVASTAQERRGTD
jgi:DNA-binding CsgD family transcriptional regulator